MNLETCLSVRPYFVLGQQAIVATTTIHPRICGGICEGKVFRASGSIESSQASVSVRVEEAPNPVLGVVHSSAVWRVEESVACVPP
jgi:hypothetical protein